MLHLNRYCLFSRNLEYKVQTLLSTDFQATCQTVRARDEGSVLIQGATPQDSTTLQVTLNPRFLRELGLLLVEFSVNSVYVILRDLSPISLPSMFHVPSEMTHMTCWKETGLMNSLGTGLSQEMSDA